MSEVGIDLLLSVLQCVARDVDTGKYWPGVAIG